MRLDKERIVKALSIHEGFDESQANWEELDELFRDYESIIPSLQTVMESVRSMLHAFPAVHSVRARLKDSYHLIEKCIRKRLAEPSRVLTRSTYRTEIADLIGLRAIHLYKTDWPQIHEAILRNWEPLERPIAYYREGDPAEMVELFKQYGLEPKTHPKHYRSIHYLISSQLTRDRVTAEIQVRTLFEEGWSEIDHKLRYPHGADPMVSQWLALLNRIAGAGDEMAAHISALAERLTTLEAEIKKETQHRDEIIAQLRAEVSELNIKKQEKERIYDGIERLAKSAVIGGASGLGEILTGLAAGVALQMGRKESGLPLLNDEFSGEVVDSPSAPPVKGSSK